MTVASVTAARAEARARTQLVFNSQEQRLADYEYGRDVQLKAFKDQVHYDLVEVTWKDGMVAHIPAPFFIEFHRGLEILLHLPHSARVRDHEFFHCPICGIASYFTEPCSSCSDGETFETVHTNDNWKAWMANSKRKTAREVHLLGRLRHGHRAPGTVLKMEYVCARPRFL
jgi:hypothetical protein